MQPIERVFRNQLKYGMYTNYYKEMSTSQAESELKTKSKGSYLLTPLPDGTITLSFVPEEGRVVNLNITAVNLTKLRTADQEFHDISEILDNYHLIKPPPPMMPREPSIPELIDDAKYAAEKDPTKFSNNI